MLVPLGLVLMLRLIPAEVLAEHRVAAASLAERPVSYAGAAGYVGLYQVNIPIPATTPPGAGISLTLKQGGILSNAVTIALQ